jgi:hypothetical protein
MLAVELNGDETNSLLKSFVIERGDFQLNYASQTVFKVMRSFLKYLMGNFRFFRRVSDQRI